MIANTTSHALKVRTIHSYLHTNVQVGTGAIGGGLHADLRESPMTYIYIYIYIYICVQAVHIMLYSVDGWACV